MSSDINGTVIAMHPNVSSLKTSNYTITSGDYYIGVGILTASITVSLPSSPASGDQYLIKDVDGYAGSFPIIVSGNGKNIDGNTSISIAQNYASFTFTYTGNQWSISVGYAGVQNGNGFGVFANRPMQGQAGRTYYGTDTSMMYYDDGYTWNPIGQTDVCTALKTSDFTWGNQNGATSTDFGSGIFLTAPSNVGTQNIRYLYKTAPTAPYTVTAKFIDLSSFQPSAGVFYGLAFSDGTKLITLHVNTNNTAFNLNVANWNNYTSFTGADDFDENSYAVNNQLQWLRIADDGTNRNFSIFRDGVNFYVFYSMSNTSFLTTSRVGIVLNPGSCDMNTSCVSWKIT